MPEGGGAIDYRLKRVEDRSDKLYTDMYEGEGKENPSMTVRMDRVEKATESMAESAKASRNMMLVTMLTVVGGVLTAFICYKLGIRI